MGKTAFPGSFAQRTTVRMRGRLVSMAKPRKLARSKIRYVDTIKVHPDYEAAKTWCLGPNIKGRFLGRKAGNFDFEDAQDAVAFKLAWG